VISALDLQRWGLRWSHAPAVLAHVLPDDRCAVLSRDRDATAASVGQFAAADASSWLALVEEFDRIREPLLESILRPFPPIRGAAGLLRRLGAADALRFARFAASPVRRFSQERFRGEGAALLLAGNASHTDLSPENAGSALYGWLLSMLGQTTGFPVPVGGSGELIRSMLSRLRAAGGEVRLAAPVARVLVHGRRATGVRLASGEQITAGAVLADVGAPALYRELVGTEYLPPRLVRDLDGFQWDPPTLKVNWALTGPIPWTAVGARGAGTVHLGVDLDGLTRYAADLTTRDLPARPFLLLGQMTTADASRSPAGTESAWAYTHLPAGRQLTADDVAGHVQLVEATIERHAPGFGDLIGARTVQGPHELEAADANLVSGAVGGGTSALHQQLLFRPTPGLSRAETPIDGLYLASSAAHPGGGVHGSPGANAARAALLRTGRLGGLHRRGVDLLLDQLYAERRM
jgi:phytoene dehydrogenase-like protein